MRILITVPWGDRLGGAEAMLQTALAGADRSGHEVELVFFEPGSWPQELIDAGFRVEVIAAGRLRQVHRTIATILRLARLLRQRQPDLVLNWSAKTQLYGSVAATLAGMRRRVAWWQQAIPPRRGWLDRIATLLPASAVCCYSEAASRAQRDLFPSRPTFVIAAGSPVPDPPTEQPALKLPGGVPIVGLVGRLQPWKGQDRLLKAQALLRARGQNLHLLIVGGDSYGLSPEYAESLASLADGLGLADAVTMTGQVPDAGPYMDKMDVLVNASDPEPFGIVLLEAMARGLAVVAVDSGGPAEFIEDGRTGVLARSGEPQALADALQPLLASSSLRRELGQAGRDRFLREFTDSAMQERFFDSLERIVRDQGGQGHPGREPSSPAQPDPIT
jgi:glycosyltransferase involved in cell wall biosynthesis